VLYKSRTVSGPIYAGREGPHLRMKEKVPSGEWGTLRVVAKGNHFEVYHKRQETLRVEDETFKQAGKIGLWTRLIRDLFRRSDSDRP